MSNEFVPKKAQKAKVKLKLAIQGPSGSGKTEGALALAKNFFPNGKILLIDTENESASLYADRYDFDTIPLTAPYSSKRYQEAMKVAVTGGYDVLIVDSITHQWDGEGGILRRKEAMDRQGGNSFTNWSSFTPEHTAFVEFIKQLPIHTITTMRTKQTYVLEANDKGKQQPRKVGMDPIQREGMEYEYTIVFDVNMVHGAKPSKNRTTLFQDEQPIDLRSQEVAAEIRAWLENGVDAPAPSSAPEVPASTIPPLPNPMVDWLYEGGRLTCSVIDTRKAESKKKQGEYYFVVKVNGQINGKETLYCWHKSLFDALSESKGHTCEFIIEESGDYANIIDVVFVGLQEYREGQKVVEQASKPNGQINSKGVYATDDDIPF